MGILPNQAKSMHDGTAQYAQGHQVSVMQAHQQAIMPPAQSLQSKAPMQYFAVLQPPFSLQF